MPFAERLRDDTLSAVAFDAAAGDDPPARARVVVIGGGIIGSSVAFHLAQLGWTDVVVVERGKVSCGTTWHAAGLVTRTRATHLQTELALYSGDFYKTLAERAGVDAGYYESNALSLAQTPERMTELRYVATMAHHHGLSAHRLTPGEIAAVAPIIASDDLVGGVLFEGDATVNPGWAAFATAKAAHDLGVRFVEGCRTTGFRLAGGRVAATGPGPAGPGTADGRIVAVETDRGTIECEVVVVAAGLWSRDLALLAGARIALHPAEHMWVQTEPIAGADRDLPIVRDMDGHFYLRHYRGGLLIGAFEPDGKPRSTSSIPADFAFGEFGPDWQHFELPLAKGRRRVPALTAAGFIHFLNAPESFTPDVNFLLGETAEVAGLYVAAGFNSQGIIFGPGAGKALAEWIAEGAATIDAAEIDVRRFASAQANERYLFERTRESLGRLYALHWPFLQPKTARGLRRVPLHDRLAAAGACFGEATGWERANWYARPGAAEERDPDSGLPAYRYSYGRQNWFAASREEHRAAREGVALFDLSSFAKFRIEGPGALAAVQRVFPADLDCAPGSVAYTCLLNERGGVEDDLTVTRLDEDSFLVVTAAAAQAKVFHLLRRRLAPAAGRDEEDDAAVAAPTVTDVSSALGVLALAGPRSREVLARLTDAALDARSFPFATARSIEVGRATALAIRVSFTGELGWELYAPTESLAALYDDLIAAGPEVGLRHAGYHALDSLRLERGFRHWGLDIGPADTPYEVGLGSTVALEKLSPFVGREALRRRVRAAPQRRLVHVKLDDPEPLLYGNETVLRGGQIVGRVTSGAYGHTLGAAVGLALLEAAPEELAGIVGDVEAARAGHVEATRAAHIEVEIAGVRVPATLGLTPFYDPRGVRLRG
jgi:4-methylaminobutanoate oxidase (formaldehyde-forming)